MSDYFDYWKEKEKEWEDLCLRCGACCGAYDDPCKYLKKDKDGKYFCQIYENRFGLRETISGEKFWCVPIKELIKRGINWPKSYLCGYKKALRIR